MKGMLKTAADALAILMVLPALPLYGLGILALGRQKAFPGWSQAFSLLPGFVGVYLRRAFYRLTLRGCGRDTFISFGTVLASPDSELGRSVYTGVYCCLGAVTLEDDVLLSSYVSVMNGSGQHGIERLDIPMREQQGKWPRITIGRDSWIGERTLVMADVGKHCVVGAGSVVTKPIPDYAIAVGSPAKVIRYREGAPVS